MRDNRHQVTYINVVLAFGVSTVYKVDQNSGYNTAGNSVGRRGMHEKEILV